MLRVASRPLTVLSDEQIETLHQASLRLLEEVGVEMLDGRAVDLLAHQGAEVDRASHRVRLPRELVSEAVSRAPARFTLHGRDPRKSVEMGGDSLVLAPAGGPMMVEEGSERRPGSYQDQLRFIKLTHHARLLDITYRCVEALDLPAATRHLDYLHAAVRYSDKPIGVMSLDATAAEDCLAVASLLAGGRERLPDVPMLMGGVNVDSPLRFSRETLEGLMAFAEAGQPLKITPFVLAGVMSPVTPAGSLVQQNAEVLAGIALAQMVRPGAPVVYGSFGTVADMRSGSPMFGTAEGVLMEVAAGQLAGRYGVPHRGMGLVTSSPLGGVQAALEKASCLWGLVLSNTHLLIQAAGWLEGGLTASYEQFALDLEMWEGMERFLAGLHVDGEAMALESMARVGPGGSFLMDEHTLAHYRDSIRASPLMETRGWDAWLADGARTVEQRAGDIWRRWLEEYQEPPIDAGVEEAVREYVERRKSGEPPGVPAGR